MELGLPFESYVEQYRYKYLALYHAIRAAIHSGKSPEGTRLPLRGSLQSCTACPGIGRAVL